ncbi:PAS domain-containing protein [Aquimarina gracilis]|uniref:histidine kinase n=1 Tax=Aquimarina gracilis TaxID=874422 RepID=A0ABU5ZW41_9FLAO|nr:PAS domain-containing protein [Aquimarina gracilis]MEB3346073.1 PAS domain-containing protein [Aquimarina gracilis]
MPFTAEQFGILAEKTLHFLLILKKNGRIIAFNNRCGILFPIEKNQKAAKYITDYIIDEDVKVFNRSISSLNEKNSILSESFSFVTEEQGVLSLKFNLTLYNDLIYAAGIDTTEEYKEHRALMTISKLTKTGAWYYNPKNNEMFWSKGCYLIKDLDPKTEMTRELGASFYPKENRGRVESYLSNLIKTKKPYQYTEKIITHKGNEKWVKVVAHPVIYKNEVIYVNGTIADVTDRHNYIEKLKYNEETKHLALKGIRSGLFDHHIEKNEVFYSADFKKMLGLPLDQDFVPEEKFRKMIHPEDVDNALKRHLDNLKKTGFQYYNYYRLSDKKGNYKHYEVHGFRRKNENGETIRMIGNLIDVHQKKINEKTISENKNRLQAIVNNGFAYTVLLDINGKILIADKKSLKIIKRDFNVDPTQTDCQFIDVMPINFKSSFTHNFNEALKGNTIKKETERITAEGKTQWLETKYTPIFDDEYKINSVLISFHDISERKHAQKAITEAHIREQELSNLKSNILSNFSHEIRTPLNGIMTISNLILENKFSEDKKKLLKYLEESKDRLLDTMNKLSNFSEIHAIHANLNFEEVDINYVVETSFREHKYIADSKGLDYQLKLDSNSPQAKIDVNLFRPALNNIIHNAIKYTKNGRVKISISSEVSKKNVYIYVKDSGIGIDKKDFDKIFEPLIQGSSGINREYEGTGIGLSLSKRYIEILGGRIKLKSKLSEGTKFIIIIPKCL